MNLRLDELVLEVQPEVAEVVMQKKLAKEYFCWLLLKELDAKIGKNGGQIPKDKMFDLLQELTGRSYSAVYRYFMNGIDIFWRYKKIKKDEDDEEKKPEKKMVYLIGQTKVVSNLGIENIYSFNLKFPADLVGDKFSNCNGLLLLSVACKNGKPVSVAGLADRCNVAPRTVQNYTKKFKEEFLLNILNNYEVLEVFGTFENAKDRLNEISKVYGVEYNSLRIRRYNDHYLIARQMPNTYATLLERTSIQKARNTLRAYQQYPALTRNEKLYVKLGAEDIGLQPVGLAYEDEGWFILAAKEPNTVLYRKRESRVDSFFTI